MSARVASLVGQELVAQIYQERESARRNEREGLLAILRANAPASLEEATWRYGLGGLAASEYGVRLLTEARLVEVCPYFVRSLERIEALDEEFYQGADDELRTAITELACESQ